LYGGTTASAVVATQGNVITAAGVNVFCPIGIVLDKDECFRLGCGTANVAFYVTLFGYDRRAEVSELG